MNQTTAVTTQAFTLRRFVTQWWIAFTASSVFVVSGHLLIKGGLNIASHAGRTGVAGLLHTVFQIEVLTGLAIYMMGSLCWMIAVAQCDISFLYPLSSVNYVLVVITSCLLFADRISPQRGAGVMLIVLGMVLMNRTAERQVPNES